MKLEIQLDKDFENEFNRLKEIYPNEMFELEGLTEDKLDPTRFFKAFIHSDNVANASIDDNSNVNDININIMLNESDKPFKKLLAFNKVFIELKESFDLQTASKWLSEQISGSLYSHDPNLFSYFPYCYAFSVRSIAEKGLYFIKEMSAESPKHLSAYNRQILQFVSYASNQQAGAVGLPDYLLYSYYFWQKDVKSGYIPESIKDKIKEQEFQSTIFDLNQPFMKVTQSAYTNFTIMDREYFVGLFGGLTFPDGSYAIDHIDNFIQYQKDWLDFVKRLRFKKSFTFPVITTSCLFDKETKKFKDSDMVKYVVNHNMTWGDSNIYISNSVDSLASCCFSGDQTCLTKSSTTGVMLKTFEELSNILTKDRKNFRIFHNGNWVDGKLVKINRENKKLFKVKTINNKELLVTEDHINLTLRGDVYTIDLIEDDYIAFNTMPLARVPENDMKLSYSQGMLIGAYLGDGSKKSNNNGIVFSMNEKKVDLLYPHFRKAIKEWGLDINIIVSNLENNNVSVSLSSPLILEIIETWIYGDYCYEKDLNLDCLLQNIDFRQGILDGLYATDGGNSNRIYSTSKKQTYSIEALITSLGLVSIIDVSDRTGEGNVIIRGESFNRNYPLYCIRFYGTNNKNLRKMKDIYVKRNNTIYFKIESIEEITYNEDKVYCFEMADRDEPYFTLPNGIITHNCRLINNLEAIDKDKDTAKLQGHFNSIGGSDLNIGSSKVITVNLPRIAYKSKGNFNIVKDELKNIIDTIHKTHFVHRKILQKNIDRGLLPLYTHGLISLDKQFGTVGVTGVMEYIEFMGGIDRDASGIKYNTKGLKLAKETLQYINELNETTLSKYGFTANVEQIPSESASIKLCKKDKMLFKDLVKCDLYSNQWIALSENADLMERIRVSGKLDSECGGGQILHINTGEPYSDLEQAWKMTNLLAKKGIIYYSDIRKIKYCKNDHNFFNDKCPECGNEPIGEIVKIVGYMTKNAYYKKERKEELNNRKFYDNDVITSFTNSEDE